MRQGTQRIDLFAVQQNVQFYEVRRSKSVHMPFEGRITLTDRFEFVVEINHDLAQRHIEENLHTVSGYILLLHEFTAFS